MSLNIRILREPGPGDAANGNGNGVSDLPRGPVGKSILEEMLEAADPIGGKVKIPGKTSPEGEQEPNEDPATELEPGNEEQPGSEEVLSEEAAGELDETTQAHVAELSRLLAEGGLSIGEVKRIKKLLQDKLETGTAMQQLRDQVAELTQKLEGNGGHRPPLQPVEANPFRALVKDAETLSQAKREMYDIREWCEDNAEGGTRGDKEFTAEQVKQLRREAQRALDIHLPGRERELQGEATVAASRGKMRDFMKSNVAEFYDRETAEGQLAEQFRQAPEMQGRPDGDVIAAALALGMPLLKKRIADRAAAKGKPNGPNGRPGTVINRNLPPKPGAGGARAGNGVVLKKAVGKLLQSGKRDDFADVLDAMGAPGGSPTRKN